MKLSKEVKSSRVVNRFARLEADFIAIHKGFYSYEKAIYVNAKTKMIITCASHGDFKQTSNVHLRGDGCPTCGHLKTISGSVQRAKEKFPIEATEIHNNKYGYSLVEYKNARTKVKIICPVHGAFNQSPDAHLKGKGCKKCAVIETSDSQRFTREQVINKCNSIHNSFYSYDNMEYKAMTKKIVITCPNHGDFSAKAQAHFNGSGCPKCSGRGFSSLEWKERFNDVHGDKYDYSLFSYNGKYKSVITCKIHGDFLQTASVHVKGHGCPNCGIEKQSEGKRKDINVLLKEFQKVHQGLYQYEDFEYTNNFSKAKIVCAIHGRFEQTTSNHLKGKGCAKCAGQGLSQTERIQKFVKAHGDKYDYSKCYFDGIEKIAVICPEHGEFLIQPSSHLSGVGCSSCSGNKPLSESEVISRFKEVHGDEYDYSKFVYKNFHSKGTIICNTHGAFQQNTGHHSKGQGCPGCAKTGFSANKPGILYYLKIGEGSVYKIGITNKSVEERFPSEMSKIKIIKTWLYADGLEAYEMEQRVLNEFKDSSYTGPELLKSGNTELFEWDVLGLDNQ